jgi:hypothetical protein
MIVKLSSNSLKELNSFRTTFINIITGGLKEEDIEFLNGDRYDFNDDNILIKNQHTTLSHLNLINLNTSLMLL